MQLEGSRLKLVFELVVARAVNYRCDQVCSLCIVPCLEGLCVSCGQSLSLDPTNCTSEAEEIGRDQCRMVQRFRTLMQRSLMQGFRRDGKGEGNKRRLRMSP